MVDNKYKQKEDWWFSVISGIGLFTVLYLGFLLLTSFLTGCAPLQWAVTQDPITGMVPALSALPEAVDGGLSGLVSGGIFGLLAFAATFGKTLRRMYLERGKKKK